eukprot:UN04962
MRNICGHDALMDEIAHQHVAAQREGQLDDVLHAHFDEGGEAGVRPKEPAHAIRHVARAHHEAGEERKEDEGDGGGGDRRIRRHKQARDVAETQRCPRTEEVQGEQASATERHVTERLQRQSEGDRQRHQDSRVR